MVTISYTASRYVSAALGDNDMSWVLQEPLKSALTLMYLDRKSVPDGSRSSNAAMLHAGVMTLASLASSLGYGPSFPIYM